MSYKPKPLTHYERTFVLGAGFLSASAFVYDGHALLTNAYPIHAFVLYAATLCMCLQVLLRYFIVARVFRTEKTLWAWSMSMLIAVLGPIIIHQSLLGRNWFLFTAMFLLIGNLKTIQSKRAVQSNTHLGEAQKETLSRVQVGLLWFQTYMATGMICAWALTNPIVGFRLATRSFGVSDFNTWCGGVITFAGLVSLIFSAHLAVRILSWHRHLLRLFADAPQKCLDNQKHSTPCKSLKKADQQLQSADGELKSKETKDEVPV